MALVNQTKREINVKIVFFGPEGAGKGTNLKHVFGKLKPEFRGTMKGMRVQDARMLFFDFTPPGDGSLHGFRIRIHVYTLSGPVADPAGWKMVLKGADGVVFVADAARHRQEENRKSLDELVLYLNGYGQGIDNTQCVLQYNKSDLKDAVSTGEMDRLLNPFRLPSFGACSLTGEGVLQTLLGLVKSVLSDLRARGIEGVAGGDQLQGVMKAPAGAAAERLPRVEEPAALPSAEPEAASASRTAGMAAGREPEAAARELSIPSGGEAELSGESPALEYAGVDFGSLESEMAPDPSGAAEQPRRAVEPWLIPTPKGEAISSTAEEWEAPEDNLSVELSGPADSAGPGLIFVPLTIRSGSRSKAVLLSLAISLEEM